MVDMNENKNEKVVYAAIYVDDESLQEAIDNEECDSTSGFVERELAWCDGYGLSVGDWILFNDDDDEDDDPRYRYAGYLIEWAFKHSYSDGDKSSPMSYAEWLLSEGEEGEAIFVGEDKSDKGLSVLTRVIGGKKHEIQLTRQEMNNIAEATDLLYEEEDIKSTYENEYASDEDNPSFEELTSVVPLDEIVSDFHDRKGDNDSWWYMATASIDEAIKRYKEETR